jgi:hypothetical protein
MATRDSRPERKAKGETDDPVTESTIRVPIPSPNWIVLVAATDTRVSAIELPRAAFTDPALMRSLADMYYEMRKHADD